MKKRLLSLLLLVAMIVTALPLAVLPAIAAETGEKEYAAEDYNALYVQTGLIFALDFFGTNSYWGEAAKATLLDYRWNASGDFNGTPTGTVANGALDMTSFGDYIYTKGLLALTSLGATGVTSEYVGNFSQVLSHSYFLRPNDTTVRVSAQVTENGQKFFNIYSVGARWTGSYDFREADGTLVDFKAPAYDRVNTLTFAYKNNGFTQDYYASYMYPSDVVLPDSPTLDITSGQQYFYVTHSYDPDANNGEGGVTKLETPSKVMYATFAPLITPAVSGVWDATAGEYVKTETPKRYIYSSTPRNTAAGVHGGDGLGHTGDYFHPDPGHLSFYVDGTAYYDSDVYYPDNSRVTGETHIHKQSATLNAFRQYNRILTAAELAQNRFADLAKWFKIDLSYVKLLDEASLTSLYETAANLRFEDETAAAALEQKAAELATAQFSGILSADALAIAAAYDLDVSALLTYPKGVLANTYDFLYREAASSSDVAADYAAAVKADIDAYLLGNTMTAEDYNALYVTRGLELFYDFSPMSSLWKTEGTVYTTPVGSSERTAYVYNGNTYNFTNTDDLYFYQISKNGTAITATTYETKKAADEALAAMRAEDGASTYALVKVQSLALKAAHDEWRAEEEAFFRKFLIYRTEGSVMTLTSYNTLDSDVRYTAADRVIKDFSIFTVGDGYIKMRNDGHSSGGLQATEATSLPSADGYSLQLTAALGGKLSGGVPILFHDIRPRGSTSGGMYSFGSYANVTFEPNEGGILNTDGKSYLNGTLSSAFTIPNSETETVSLTYSITGANVAGDTNDVFKIATEDGVIVNSVGNYTGTNSAKEPNATLYFGYKNSVGNMRIYAYRHYSVELTDAERLQNHFADLAKHLRLNIEGFEMLSESDKQTVYAAVTGFDLSSDRVAVQAAISSVLTPLARGVYENMKGDDAKQNAFLDVAADYMLDVSAVLSTKRDMSSVYETVTADALFCKSAAEAQVILDAAYRKAYNYLSYKSDNEDFNDYLVALADAGLAIEALMALPKSEREAVVGTALTQEAIDAYVEGKMAAYLPYGSMTVEDYNGLYVQDGRLLMVDFFATNDYWGGDALDLTQKAGASTNFKPYVQYVIPDGASTLIIKHDADARAMIDGGYYRHIKNTSSSADELTISMSSATMAASDSFTSEHVYRHEGRPTQNMFYTRHLWFRVDSSSYTEEDGATIVFGSLWNQFDRYYSSTWGSHHTTVHKFTNTSYAIGHRAMPLSFVYQNTGDYAASASGLEGSLPLLTAYAPDLEAPLFTVDTISGGDLLLTNKSYWTPDTAGATTGAGTYLCNDGSYASGTGKDYKDGYYGFGPTRTALDDYIGYNDSFDGRVYAFRYYSRALSQDETLQNHFADLVKFFRIDASAVAGLSDAERLTVYRALRECDMATSSREDVAAAYYGALNALYPEACETLSAEMAAILEKAPFDATALLAIREENARAAIAAKLTAEYSADYALNGLVLAAELKDAMAFLDSIDFVGVQVRLETKNPADEMPGVRSLFKIDEDALKALLEAAGDKQVVLGATIEIKVGETVYTKPISFYPSLDKQGNVVFDTENGGNLQTITLTDPSASFFGFAYTVTYENHGTYDSETAYALYNTEYDYSFFVKIGDVSYTRDVDYSDFKNGTVSAYKAYEHFADQGMYLDDLMLQKVIAQGATDPSAAE